MTVQAFFLYKTHSQLFRFARNAWTVLWVFYFMIKSFKLRLYPSTEQEKIFEQTLTLCCELYNAALQERIEAYKLQRKSISAFDQINELPELSKVRPDIRITTTDVLSDVLRRLDKAYSNFFRRVKNGEKKKGFPRFKSRKRYDSFIYPRQPGFKILDNKIKLYRIGEVRFHVCQPAIIGKIKTCMIKREANEWYAIISCDEVPEKHLPKTGEVIGLDVGLEYFCVTSQGEVFENPRYAKKSKAELRKSQRSLTRKIKGSNHRKKAVLRVQRHYLKVKRQRRHFHFQIANELVRRYDVIYIEQLSIRNMVRNSKLSFSISDAAWYQFQEILIFKAAEAGKLALRVNSRNTSNEDSISGKTIKKKLSQRWHTLPSGEKIHRDHNAAMVIKKRGIHAHERQADAIMSVCS